jgi:hypothetical protein
MGWASRVWITNSRRNAASSRARYRPTRTRPQPNRSMIAGPTTPIHAFPLREPNNSDPRVINEKDPPRRMTPVNHTRRNTRTNGCVAVWPEITVPFSPGCIVAIKKVWKEFRYLIRFRILNEDSVTCPRTGFEPQRAANENTIERSRSMAAARRSTQASGVSDVRRRSWLESKCVASLTNSRQKRETGSRPPPKKSLLTRPLGQDSPRGERRASNIPAVARQTRKSSRRIIRMPRSTEYT